MRKLDQPVKKYWLKVTKDNVSYEYDILAINSDSALSMVNRNEDWDTITLRKITDIIGFASYSARNISNDNENGIESLEYHCRPISYSNR